MSSGSCSTCSTEESASNITYIEGGMAKGPAASETSKKSFFSEMISTTSQSKAHTRRLDKKRAALLEEQLRREKEEHWRTKEEHRKMKEALDLSIKRHQAAMAGVLDLQEQIQKLQFSSQQPSQQYEEALVFDIIQENLRREADVIRRRPTP
jgi:hypothetical protein